MERATFDLLWAPATRSSGLPIAPFAFTRTVVLVAVSDPMARQFLLVALNLRSDQVHSTIVRLGRREVASGRQVALNLTVALVSVALLLLAGGREVLGQQRTR